MLRSENRSASRPETGRIDWRAWLLLTWVVGVGFTYVKAMTATRWGAVASEMLHKLFG